MPSVLPPPVFKDADSTPLSALGGASLGAGAAKQGPSDFTRMISQAPPPVVPEVQATPAKSQSATKPAKRNLPIGLIVIINVVILLTLALVFFLLRTPQPAVPTVPKAPTVKVPDAPKPPEVPKTP